MNEITEIISLLDKLKNALTNLESILPLFHEQKEKLEEMNKDISSRELSLSDKEAKFVVQLKELSQKDKDLNIKETELKGLQHKLEEERIIISNEKTKIEEIKEKQARERVRLENMSKKIDQAKTEILAESEIITKKQKGLSDLGDMLKEKERKLNSDKEKVERILNA